MSSWSFANARDWVPDLPIDPPMTEFEKYEYEWEQWLHDNYEEATGTVFGIDFDDYEKVEEMLWDRFMAEVVEPRYDGP